MIEIQLKRWNLIIGWFVCGITFLVYACTAEPTNSFWDIGEYIATSSKLQIAHPPGAPFFQIFGAFVSNFAPDKMQIAYSLHLMSAGCAGLTIALLFWSTILLLKKVVPTSKKMTKQHIVIIYSSAFIGSLALAFTDSFWFNAVEAEVYAMATCSLSLLFYLGLLWERDMDTYRGHKWLVLISLIIGISFGIHFMALLVIPSIVLLYYFKSYKKKSIRNLVLAHGASIGMLLIIFKILIPYTLTILGNSEIFFTNTIGLPFHSGTIIAILILCIGFFIGIKYSYHKNYSVVHTTLLCISFILIGFTSWMMIPIRANAGTVINENNPDNAKELLSYYNLEQYPSNPLLFGPLYTEKYAYLDEKSPYKDGKPKYEKNLKTNTYEIINSWQNSVQNLDDSHKSIFPRMWNTEKAINYIKMGNVPIFEIKDEYKNEKKLRSLVFKFKREYVSGKRDAEDYDQFLQQFGQYLEIQKPSVLENISFFMKYQVSYMYWRYFMWNFVGKQNDIQGKGGSFNGNWLSGVKFIDEWHLGSQEKLPSSIIKNKGRNTYYFLPLIIGIIGFVFHYKRDKKNWWILMVFFLLTGIALKVYLNEKPYEVRERDYVLVGSFYVFSIWIAFGVYAIIDHVRRYSMSRITIPVVILLCILAAPGILISQNWDDHNRSDRYTARAMAKNYLSSCQENGILFTTGDNDTFPLWYIQEIEEFRTDIRLICTTLFATDWYIDQMKRTAYESKPIPSQLPHDFYKFGSNDIVQYQPISDVDKPILIKKWMNWIQSKDPRTKGQLRNGKSINTFPSKKIRIPVDKEAVLKNNIVAPHDADKILPYIDIEIKSNYLLKHRLLMLDIIANNNWERPIYFSGGSYGDDDYIWMKEYLQLDGLVYKLVPIKTEVAPKKPFDYGRIDTELMYKIVKEWDWGNGDCATIYHDPETRINSISYRNSLGRLALALISEQKNGKAKEILDLGMQKMPLEFYEYFTSLSDFVVGYYEINDIKSARTLWDQIIEKYQEQLIYFSNLSLADQKSSVNDIIISIERYRSFLSLLNNFENREYREQKNTHFNTYLQNFTQLYSEY